MPVEDLTAIANCNTTRLQFAHCKVPESAKFKGWEISQELAIKRRSDLTARHLQRGVTMA